MNNEDIELLLVEYKDTIKRLRYLQLTLEDKLQNERGLKLYDALVLLDKKSKEAIKEQREQQREQQSSNLSNNSNNKNNVPLYFQHFQ
jgi:hypothetical protein